jgi:DNA integrity scanning protein DisA with diadenylate cyclase activity/mannitol/fructose-specific phosphotransferase system IIA component (Ntr-type)
MRIDRYFTRNRTIDLKSTTFRGALKELLDVSVGRFKDLNKEKLLSGLLAREGTMTTYLGNGVSLPHLRVKMSRRFIFAVGRSVEGIPYDGHRADEKAHLIFLLIASESARGYLQVLASIARLVKEQEFVDGLVEAPDLTTFFERLSSAFGGLHPKPAQFRQNKVNRLIFKEAEKIASGSNCSSIAIFGDTLNSAAGIKDWFPKFKTILVIRNIGDGDFDHEAFSSVIQVRSFSKSRMAQLRSAVLIGMTRGIIQINERICCVGGIPGSDQFDTVMLVDVQREFKTLLGDESSFLPPDVKPEVLERVIAIATELAVEGREGRPVGSMFVLGDTAKVEKMTKPLVLNPFFGYKEEDRNILNPFMDETIKEFSSIDGAFIIRGDGLLVSSGSLIHAPDYAHSLPGGLGARHAAAAAISLATDCISIVVSSSSGQVTVFRRGVLLALIEKDFARSSQNNVW